MTYCHISYNLYWNSGVRKKIWSVKQKKITYKFRFEKSITAHFRTEHFRICCKEDVYPAIHRSRLHIPTRCVCVYGSGVNFFFFFLNCSARDIGRRLVLRSCDKHKTDHRWFSGHKSLSVYSGTGDINDAWPDCPNECTADDDVIQVTPVNAPLAFGAVRKPRVPT